MLLNFVSSNTPVKLRKFVESRMPPACSLSQGARALGHTLGTADTTAARGGGLTELGCQFVDGNHVVLSNTTPGHSQVFREILQDVLRRLDPSTRPGKGRYERSVTGSSSLPSMQVTSWAWWHWAMP